MRLKQDWATRVYRSALSQTKAFRRAGLKAYGAKNWDKIPPEDVREILAMQGAILQNWIDRAERLEKFREFAQKMGK